MKENIKIINLEIDINTLADAMANCNLGLGTYKNPIAADYFVTNLDTDNSTMVLSDKKLNTLQLTVSGNSLKYMPELLEVFIYPSGRKETVLSGNAVKKLFNKIFESDGAYITKRQFCIPSKDNKCNLKIKLSGKEEMGYYFTYKILFKLEIYNFPFCFSIDPFFKIRSRDPK